MTGECSEPGCHKPVVGRGWCRTHYNRWWKHGDPTVVLPRNGPKSEETRRKIGAAQRGRRKSQAHREAIGSSLFARFAAQDDPRDADLLGALIRRRRYDLGLRQPDVSRAIDRVRRTVSDWENDRQPPTDRSLRKLADVLGLPLSELVEARRRSHEAGLYAPSDIGSAGRPASKELERLNFKRISWNQFQWVWQSPPSSAPRTVRSARAASPSSPVR